MDEDPAGIRRRGRSGGGDSPQGRAQMDPGEGMRSSYPCRKEIKESLDMFFEDF